jgi:hypothetical protein
VTCYLEHAHLVERAVAGGDDVDLHLYPLLQANVAWSATKAGRRDLDDLVERFSREALEAFPEAPEMTGTRGAWLIVLGRHDEGLALLAEAVRRISDPIDKADFCDFIARGWVALADPSRATFYQELRMHLGKQTSQLGPSAAIAE